MCAGRKLLEKRTRESQRVTLIYLLLFFFAERYRSLNKERVKVTFRLSLPLKIGK